MSSNMVWYDDDNQWVSLQSQSPVMYYLNFILLVSFLVIIGCTVFFVIRECCRDNQGDEERETIIIRQPAAQVPTYTETTQDKDQAYSHRIVHEYNRQSVAPSSADSQLAPHRYYAYDQRNLATHYMYPTPCSTADRPGTSSSASETARLAQRNYGDLPPPRMDDRPPPYAPNH